jgi:hypothetical protein
MLEFFSFQNFYEIKELNKTSNLFSGKETFFQFCLKRHRKDFHTTNGFIDKNLLL